MSQLPKRKAKAPERFQVMEKGSFSVDYQNKKESDDLLQRKMYQANYKEATKAMAELDDQTDENKKQKAGKEKYKKKQTAKKESGKKSSNKENQRKSIEEKKEKLAMRTQRIKEYQKNFREKAKQDLQEKKKKDKIYLANYKKMKKNRK